MKILCGVLLLAMLQTNGLGQQFKIEFAGPERSDVNGVVRDIGETVHILYSWVEITETEQFRIFFREVGTTNEFPIVYDGFRGKRTGSSETWGFISPLMSSGAIYQVVLRNKHGIDTLATFYVRIAGETAANRAAKIRIFRWTGGIFLLVEGKPRQKYILEKTPFIGGLWVKEDSFFLDQNGYFQKRITMNSLPAGSFFRVRQAEQAE